MIRTTRAQREALFRVFQRDFPGWITPTLRVKRPELFQYNVIPHDMKDVPAFIRDCPHLLTKVPSTQYRRFRATARPYFSDTCIMIPYAGMWLGIERDGYTHS